MMENVQCVIGTNSWGNSLYQKLVRGSYVEDTTIENMVDLALNYGIDVFDTAEDYGFGYGQKLLGRLQKTRNLSISAKFTPATKWKPGQVHKAFAKDCIDLERNVLDYYWLHLPNDVEKNLLEIADLYKAGKIRYVGISNFNLEEAQYAKMLLAKEGVPLYGVQNHFSLLERTDEKNGLLSWCRENNISYWGWAVLEEGILSGHVPSSIMGNLFKKRAEMLNPLFTLMKEIGKHHNLSVSQIAMAYCRMKGVIPIVGCRRPYQVKQLADAMRCELSSDEIAELEKMADELDIRILKTDIFRFAVKR